MEQLEVSLHIQACAFAQANLLLGWEFPKNLSACREKASRQVLYNHAAAILYVSWEQRDVVPGPDSGLN
jgi:hypothetical protein